MVEHWGALCMLMLTAAEQQCLKMESVTANLTGGPLSHRPPASAQRWSRAGQYLAIRKIRSPVSMTVG